jgi:hypothetical protein
MGGYGGNPGATDGTVMAFSGDNGGTISQDVGLAVAGATYTLSVDLLHRTDAGFASSLALQIGGVQVSGAITGADPGRGAWATYQETYTASGADAGQTDDSAAFDRESGGFRQRETECHHHAGTRDADSAGFRSCGTWSGAAQKQELKDKSAVQNGADTSRCRRHFY